MTCTEINSRVRSLRSELIALLEWERLFWDPFTAKESDREAHTARTRRRTEVLDGLQEMHRQCLATVSSGTCYAITDCEARALFSRTTCGAASCACRKTNRNQHSARCLGSFFL